MVLISFKDLYEIHIFPEFHRCGSKIVPATPFWNLNFKWAWQAEFLSHNLLSLQNCLFFTNKEMMLVSFFEINDGIWDKNFACHCHIHFLSHPWFIFVTSAYFWGNFWMSPTASAIYSKSDCYNEIKVMKFSCLIHKVWSMFSGKAKINE